MGWSYSGDPAHSDKDRVRFAVGDTDSTDPQVQDEEIQWAVDNYGGWRRAALAIARGLQAKYARLVNETVDDVSKSYSDRARAYRDVISDLETGAESGASSLPRPSAGGVSLGAKDAAYSDTDRNGTYVTPGFMDNPGGGSSR